MERRLTLMRAVGRLRRAWGNHVRQVTQKEGIPDSYRTVLLYLYNNPGSCQRNIAAFAAVTTSAVNQTVKSMLEEGYLRKETDSCDKRGTKLYLTEAGTAVAERLYSRLSVSDDAITAHLGVEKEKELIALLEELAQYIGKELDGC